jgi:serine/threonine-protein kinase RsbW
MSRKNGIEKVEVTIPSSTRHLHTMRLLTRNLAETLGFAERDCENAALAVEEALTNVIEHSYHGEASHKMQVIFELQQEKFVIRILHNGDQIQNHDLNIGKDFSDFYRQKKRGGLGILLIRKCMDEVVYKAGPKLNECCMVKYLKKNV